MEKDQLLPPPYEVPAYPKRRASHRLPLKGPYSVRAALGFLVTGSIIYLCFVVARHAAAGVDLNDDKRTLEQFGQAVQSCQALKVFPDRLDAASRKSNPRWSAKGGQNKTIVLRDARLFDGESWVPEKVDIVLSKGLITKIVKAKDGFKVADAAEYNLHGRFVTPGLVDMHSHHLALSWPLTAPVEDDDNEINEQTKEITSFLRIVDSLKAYDAAAPLIASGGVTSSLLIPGSANIVGGEGVTVKNALYSGEHGEPVVEDLLLERNVPVDKRQRYMKMAFGENPKGIYTHTRMGIAWYLRQHLQKAKDALEKQDDYCSGLTESDEWDDWKKVAWIRIRGKFPYDIKLESTVALLRGRVILHNHNYEPQDMETMLRIGEEFGFHVRGFHHATEAWQVPEMLKEKAENITIAQFAEFSGYKWEAYHPSLYAGHILDKAGIRVAYKSDHSEAFTNAKYLLSQAAVAHSFLLPEDKALQSVTSIPAKAIDLDYRIGYARAGYDADLAVWNDHPLGIGATPLQVFIDGVAQLGQDKVKESMGETFTSPLVRWATENVRSRFEAGDELRDSVCGQNTEPGQRYIFRGISKAVIENYPEFGEDIEAASGSELSLVVEDGEVTCVGSSSACASRIESLKAKEGVVEMSLTNGHITPGAIGVTAGLGIREISTLTQTGDGDADGQKISDPESIDYAKYGIWLDGKHFARARLGGVTRAITAPSGAGSGLVQGVSVELGTSGKQSLTEGGILKGEVALHLALGASAQVSEKTVSNGVKNLRKMLKDGKGKFNETVYGQVAKGELPLVVEADNKYDIEQLVLVKQDFPDANLVVLGGKESPFVAKQLAKAKIPVILTQTRPGTDVFRDKDAVVGPPLTRSIASYLTEAGVLYAVSVADMVMRSDYRIQSTFTEAGWVGKFSGLEEIDIYRLVTSNVEEILGLAPSRDLVVYEGDPLQYGSSVVMAFQEDGGTGKLKVASCFPREDDYDRRMW